MNADIRGFSVLQQRKALFWLVFFHIAVIAASNYLVQFPFTVTLPNGYEVHSTWGALSFPFIFLATDLTVRIFGRRPARRVVFFSMFPALLLSYAISVTFHQGIWQGTAARSTDAEGGTTDGAACCLAAATAAATRSSAEGTVSAGAGGVLAGGAVVSAIGAGAVISAGGGTTFSGTGRNSA